MGKKESYKREIKIIICDAGPIIHLYEGHLLHLLQNIGEVYLPHSVYLEIKNITYLNNAAKGYLKSEEAEDALNRLRNSSLWLSEKVFEEARKALIDIIS